MSRIMSYTGIHIVQKRRSESMLAVTLTDLDNFS